MSTDFSLFDLEKALVRPSLPGGRLPWEWSGTAKCRVLALRDNPTCYAADLWLEYRRFGKTYQCKVQMDLWEVYDMSKLHTRLAQAKQSGFDKLMLGQLEAAE